MKTHLYSRARMGDPAATREVIEALLPQLRGLSVHYARMSRVEADDLLQEALLTVLRAISKVDITIVNPHCYLLKMARWRMLDVLKSAGRSVETISLEETEQAVQQDLFIHTNTPDIVFC